jgi:hypothetical protein
MRIMPPPPKKPIKPEPKGGLQKAIAWAFIILGAGAIAYMIATNPPQKKLVCNRTTTSITGIGACSEE